MLFERRATEFLLAMSLECVLEASPRIGDRERREVREIHVGDTDELEAVPVELLSILLLFWFPLVSYVAVEQEIRWDLEAAKYDDGLVDGRLSACRDDHDALTDPV